MTYSMYCIWNLRPWTCTWSTCFWHFNVGPPNKINKDACLLAIKRLSCLQCMQISFEAMCFEVHLVSTCSLHQHLIYCHLAWRMYTAINPNIWKQTDATGFKDIETNCENIAKSVHYWEFYEGNPLVLLNDCLNDSLPLLWSSCLGWKQMYSSNRTKKKKLLPSATEYRLSFCDLCLLRDTFSFWGWALFTN